MPRYSAVYSHPTLSRFLLMTPVSPGDKGPVPISDKMSYRKISWSLEAARLVVQIIASLWNLTGTSTALLPVKFQSDRTILNTNLAASRLCAISYSKTCYRILKRGPVSVFVPCLRISNIYIQALSLWYKILAHSVILCLGASLHNMLLTGEISCWIL